MAIKEILPLCKRRWALPVLGLLAQGHAERVYPLSQSLSCSRLAVKQAMDLLQSLNLLVINSGHGHPLRPEYLLTTSGKTLAAKILLLWQNTQHDDDLIRVVYARWSLPVLLLSQQQVRFAQIRATLKPITDRALSQSLSGLTKRKLLLRKVDITQHPPASLYQTSLLGQQLISPLTPQILQ
ncbi:MAG: winged helix-turn-helix transcriptional regulator [Robiginitomaculum sp.]|nr:winged helix-turn-helix transcriptional regulator [Robiginitomaculum sp.]